MENIKKQIEDYLALEDKEKLYTYINNLLLEKKIDILDLYAILTPLLNNWVCDVEDEEVCIWKEHTRSANIRTVIEGAYPYVIEKKKELNLVTNKRAVVICPPEEFHDIGAKMVADYLTILGLETTFVGQNTPFNDFINGIKVIKPAIIGISVGNYYNLVATKKIINEIKATIDFKTTILVGGVAFNDNIDEKAVNADYCCQSFEELKEFVQRGDY